MKFLPLLLAALPLPALAATEEKIEAKVTVSVQDLRCVTMAAAPDSPTTELGDRSTRRLGLLNADKLLKLTHETATAAGCDLASLSAIHEEAIMRFGFQHEVPTLVTRVTSDPYRADNGKCLQQIDETIRLDLGRGVVVESREAVIQKAKGCR